MHEIPVLQILNRFSIQLFSTIWSSRENDNVIFSPYSALIALSMLYSGTHGETASEIAQVLGITGLSPLELNQLQLELRASFRRVGHDVRIKSAQALWLDESISTYPAFTDTLNAYYGSGVYSFRPDDPEIPSRINHWIHKETKGLISNAIDQIDPTTIMILISALYFEASWEEFHNVPPAPFTLPDGSQKLHPMMQTDLDTAYVQTTEFEAIRIPLDGNEAHRLSVVIVLPSQHDGLLPLQEQFSIGIWNEWVRLLDKEPQTVLLTMPLFRCEAEIDLTKPLRQLGIRRIFELDQADFTEIAAQPMALDRFEQKAYIEADENGIRAGAVTWGSVMLGMGPLPEFEMNVNRPFLYAIRDDITGIILFMGCMTDPLQPPERREKWKSTQ